MHRLVCRGRDRPSQTLSDRTRHQQLNNLQPIYQMSQVCMYIHTPSLQFLLVNTHSFIFHTTHTHTLSLSLSNTYLTHHTLSLIHPAEESPAALSPHNLPDDLFAILFKCQSHGCPWRALLAHAVVLQRPLLAILAACNQVCCIYSSLINLSCIAAGYTHTLLLRVFHNLAFTG